MNEYDSWYLGVGARGSIAQATFGWSCCICATWLIHMSAMTYLYVWHGSFICVKGLIYMCDMTHSCMRHGFAECNVGQCCCTCATSLIQICDSFRSLIGAFICMKWLIHMFDINPSFVWHDSFTWCCTVHVHHVPFKSVTHSYVWHSSLTCVTWLIHVFALGMTHSCVWLEFLKSVIDSQLCLELLHVHIYVCVAWIIHICDMTHSYLWRCCCACKVIWMSHVTHMHESFTHMNRCCQTYNESCQSFECFSRMNASCHTYE